MSENSKINFVKMAKQGIMGGLVGIFAGVILGIIIFYLQYLLTWITNPGLPIDLANKHEMWPTAAVPGTLGACFGALIGSLFRSILGLRETSRK
jgi:uncharacterized membrane protein